MRCTFHVLLAGLLCPVLTFGLDPKAETPPVARKIPHRTELHGETLVDDYFWLREKKNPAVLDYLKAENAYTAAVMKPTEPLQAVLYNEVLGRIKQTDLSVPYRQDGYYYYTRTVEGKQYPVYCRKKGTLEAPEEVLLDGNEMAQGQKFLSIIGLNVSNDGNLLAFLTDVTGYREYYLSVKDLRAGKLLEDRSTKVSLVVWAADNRTLYYVTEDAAKRPYRLYRRSVGAPPSAGELVYEEKDELYRLMVSRTHDRKYLLRTSLSSTTSELAFLPAAEPAGEWKVMSPRREGHQYNVDHREGLFYIRTNQDGATNFRLMTCPVGDTASARWKPFGPYRPEVMVTGLLLFRNHAVVSEREDCNPQLRVIDLNSNAEHRISFPEPVYSAMLGTNPEYDTVSVQFTYTSLTTPQEVYEYDLTSRQRKLLKRTEVPGGYDPASYVSERVAATAADGIRVPVSLVYKKGLKRDGKAGCLLYGYGSYGLTLPVRFDPGRVSLLDRGVIYAQAHIRGGSDLGRKWYEDGKMMRKKNTFTDFIAAADFLVAQKYCDRGRLVLEGRSAGGLLVGATINLRPDLCKAAILQVPFVDVVNTMLDESLPLTVPEFLEWGNPKKPAEYAYIKSYCPYTNLARKSYPDLLLTTSLADSQVAYHEPTKYVAKMRELNPDNLVLLRCNLDAGHGGASGRYDALKERAFVMAFALERMGLAR